MTRAGGRQQRVAVAGATICLLTHDPRYADRAKRTIHLKRRAHDRRWYHPRVTIRDRVRSLAETYGIDAFYAFGSRAGEALRACSANQTMEHGNPSDLDIGVLPKPGVQLRAVDRADLQTSLEDVFAARRVDLVILPEASAFLAADVVSGDLLFAGDADREAEFQLYVLRKAGDLAQVEHDRQAIVLGGGR